ncbi:hypothetical protein TNCV_4243761 [Trichonephila clavipes]|nr:hypothetical protein TNCV_4243761 [Trichonephila clavipes]
MRYPTYRVLPKAWLIVGNLGLTYKRITLGRKSRLVGVIRKTVMESGMSSGTKRTNDRSEKHLLDISLNPPSRTAERSDDKATTSCGQAIRREQRLQENAERIGEERNKEFCSRRRNAECAIAA